MKTYEKDNKKSATDIADFFASSFESFLNPYASAAILSISASMSIP